LKKRQRKAEHYIIALQRIADIREINKIHGRKPI
jgi:hypothetical protein